MFNFVDNESVDSTTTTTTDHCADAPQVPISVSLTAAAVALVGPLALLPAAGYWIGKYVSK